MNGSPWVWILLAIILAAGFWLYPRNRDQKNAFHARELATRKLGEYLASKFPGRRALIVSNPYVPLGLVTDDIERMESDGIAGLKKGLADKISCEAIVYPELTSEAKLDPHTVLGDKETITPLSFLVVDDAFDKVLSKHAQCDLVISLIGLPDNIGEMQCWRAEGKPAFALLLPDIRLLDGAPVLQRAFKSGKLAAFVTNRPGGPDSRVPVSSDPTEFDKRFLLVTPENIDEMIQAYPQLFTAQ